MECLNKLGFTLNVCSINGKLKLALIVGTSAVVGGFTLLTLKIYLNHRKYRHIPGPTNQKRYLVSLLKLKNCTIT